MLKALFKRLIGERANRLFLVAGVLLVLGACYQLLRTAMYVNESVVVF